jgi:hypothetical protein
MPTSTHRLEDRRGAGTGRRPSPRIAPCSSSWSPRRAPVRPARHVAVEWFPHDYIPYSLGRDFDKDPWTPDQPRLTGVAQTAFEVNLLTEDNLPSYHRLIHGMFGTATGRGSTGSAAGPPRRAPRDRPARLPDGDPEPRPDRARARPDDPAPAGLRPRLRRHACAAGLRRVPGARDADLASEHRALLARPGRPTGS